MMLYGILRQQHVNWQQPPAPTENIQNRQKCCSTLRLLFISQPSTFDFYISAPFDKCNAALEKGDCKAAHHRFGYDAAKGACIPFTYGGCGGNANRFETLEECETATATCSNTGTSKMYLELYVLCQRLW
ncbi:unnamed protein product [Dibothriocephalus latus]|uniref:BPTI/Kunitz inhibitor domain-containing protein n=1 Tax=Dibothriocephalus latus TaxID=60516 RepID=A0A3P6QN08_DIBLA|nr:unnamed protein product [Dibothriocephalus latus]